MKHNVSRDSTYTVDAIVRACRVLRALEASGAALRLRDAVERTGIPKATAFRILRSLEQGGLVEKVGRESYRSLVGRIPRPRFRIGFAAKSREDAFDRAVTEGMRSAAARRHLELVEADNRNRADVALRNADELIAAGVDLAVVFQTHAEVAAAIGAKFVEAGIPLIAVDVPHPGAIFFGGDNQRAGRALGRLAARWAVENWNGALDEVVLIEERAAGPLVHARLRGVVDGLRSVLSSARDFKETWLDGRGRFEDGWRVARKLLQGDRRRRLFAAVNDATTLGALRAIEEAGLQAQSAVVGHGGSEEIREELRRPETRLIASVAFFPENYGESLLALALDALENHAPPSATFLEHRLLRPSNVGSLYRDSGSRAAADRQVEAPASKPAGSLGRRGDEPMSALE